MNGKPRPFIFTDSTGAKLIKVHKVNKSHSIMKVFAVTTTTTTPANLKGMAKHTYNRVLSAMAEDTTAAMLHAFATLTDGAKAVALQAGKFSNLYIRGERKGMAAEEAAKELTERAAGCVTRKLRKIDHICAVAFLAEYISRQRKAIETPETPNPATNNTPTTMNANETQAPKFSELAHAKMKASPRTLKFGRNAGFYNPVDAFRFRASVLPDMHYNDDAEDQAAEIERYNRNAARCAKIAAKYGITLN